MPRHVTGPTTPSTAMDASAVWRNVWKFMTAVVVAGPNRPSTSTATRLAMMSMAVCRKCLRCGSCLNRVRFAAFFDVVAGGRAAVFRSRWPAGSGLAGFRRAGRTGGLRAEVAEPSTDPGRGEPAGSGGTFPGVAQVGGRIPVA